MSMKTAGDRTPFTLVKSSSRDNKVGCETLSHVDWYSTPKFEGREQQFHYDADDIYWDAADPDLDLDDALDAHKVGKSFPAAHLFGCFPKSSLYLPPRTMMSPGKEGRRGGADTAGRPRTHPSPIPHSGGIPHSGTIPHSGPIKLNTGSIISHSGTAKGHAKGFSWPSIIPADVRGKKKPAGYDAEEPTSPEVTCLGHVRMKHTCRRDFPNGGDKKQLCEWRFKFLKKKPSQGSTDNGVKQSASRQARVRKDQAKKAQSEVDIEEKLGSFNAAEIEENRRQRSAMFSDYVTQIAGEKGRAGAAQEEAEADYVPQVAPPNSLLLMRGSRNLERESPKPVVFNAEEVPSIAAKASVQRQVSLPKPPPEASIWKRRNTSQPTALITRIPVTLEVKQPSTK